MCRVPSYYCILELEGTACANDRSSSSSSSSLSPIVSMLALVESVPDAPAQGRFARCKVEKCLVRRAWSLMKPPTVPLQTRYESAMGVFQRHVN